MQRAFPNAASTAIPSLERPPASWSRARRRVRGEGAGPCLGTIGFAREQVVLGVDDEALGVADEPIAQTLQPSGNRSRRAAGEQCRAVDPSVECRSGAGS